jgi:enoyl-CoA hydratase/carnithine racemase
MSRPEQTAPEVGQVSVTADGSVATICLDRPAKHNALTPEMIEQLGAILIDLDADRSVRVVVLTGAGDRSFCAGADIKRFKALEPLDMWAQWTRNGLRVFDHLAKLRQPTIAAVSGNAYGGGFELALACDLRVVADDATLGLTEVGIGTLPGWGGTGRLRDLVGAGRAKQLIFTGQPMTAEQALTWGIANQLTAKSEVVSAARELANLIASKAPISVQMAKQAIDSGNAYQVMEQVASAATAYTDDAREGLASFTEKRPPDYSGR